MMAAGASDSEAIPKRAFALFFVFACMFGAGQFHRVSASVMTPVIENEFALSGDMLGFIAGVYFFASASFQIPLGLLLDRFGPPLVIPLLMAVAILGTLVFALGDSAFLLILGRIMVGIGFGGSSVIAFVAYAHWIPASKYASFTSWTLAAGNFGGIMATAPLAIAVENFGRVDSFLVIAVISAVMAVIAIVTVRDAPRAPSGESRAPASLGESLRGLLLILRNKQMRYLMAMMSVTYAPGMVVLGLWGAPYMADVFALEPVDQGNVLLAMAIAAPIGLIIIGMLERFVPSKMRIILVCARGMAAMFFLLAALGPNSLWLSVICLMGVMFFQGYYVMVQTQSRDIFPLHMVGRANTAMNTLAVIGIFIMQWVTGFIVGLFPGEGVIAEPVAYRLVFAFVGILVCAGLLTYSRIEETRRAADLG